MTRSRAGVGEVVDALRPFLGDLANTVLEEARRQVDYPTLGPASVIATSASEGLCDVLPDGGSEIVRARTLVGMPADYSRVMLLWQPPSGVFVVGYVGPYRAPRQVGGRWRRAAAQSIINAGAGTVITFDTTYADSDNLLPLVPGTTFTVPTGLAGRWLFTATGLFATPPNSWSTVQINASVAVPYLTATPLRHNVAGTGETIGTVSGTIELAEGDFCWVVLFQNSGAPINAQVDFEAHWLGG